MIGSIQEESRVNTEEVMSKIELEEIHDEGCNEDELTIPNVKRELEEIMSDLNNIRKEFDEIRSDYDKITKEPESIMFDESKLEMKSMKDISAMSILMQLEDSFLRLELRIVPTIRKKIRRSVMIDQRENSH